VLIKITRDSSFFNSCKLGVVSEGSDWYTYHLCKLTYLVMGAGHAYGVGIFAGFSQPYELVPIRLCAQGVFPAFPGFARVPFGLELQK
jgi:hypothetical protein